MRRLTTLLLVVFGLMAIPARAEKMTPQFNFKPVGGLQFVAWDGVRGDCCDSVSFLHVGGGFTLFSLGKRGNIGFIGAGAVLDFSSLDRQSVEVREASRHDRSVFGSPGSYVNFVVTIIPVRIGPVAYQVSLNNNVTSLGVQRGRVHYVTADIVGFIRLVKSIKD